MDQFKDPKPIPVSKAHWGSGGQMGRELVVVGAPQGSRSSMKWGLKSHKILLGCLVETCMELGAHVCAKAARTDHFPLKSLQQMILNLMFIPVWNGNTIIKPFPD